MGIPAPTFKNSIAAQKRRPASPLLGGVSARQVYLLKLSFLVKGSHKQTVIKSAS